MQERFSVNVLNISRTRETLCAIWQAEACNFIKSITPPRVFFMSFKIVQMVPILELYWTGA